MLYAAMENNTSTIDSSMVAIVAGDVTASAKRQQQSVRRSRLLLYGGAILLLLLLLLASFGYYDLAANVITSTTMMTRSSDNKDNTPTSHRSLLCFFSWCTGPPDECPYDPKKTKPGICGCGNSDFDTDNDGTPDCIDGCQYDRNKIRAGVCGCNKLETDSDQNGYPDCIDTCVQPVPECANFTSLGYTCNGCAQRYLTISRNCGFLNATRTANYTLEYSFSRNFVYHVNTSRWRLTNTNKVAIQKGTNSSNSRWERINDCTFSNRTNTTRCLEQPNAYNDQTCDYQTDYWCLQCGVPKPALYCLYRDNSSTPSTNPFFFMGNNETLQWLATCDPLKINPLLEP